jgi:hypothetical protein
MRRVPIKQQVSSSRAWANDRPTRAAGSGGSPSGCGFLDQALQRGAHRVVKISGGEVGAAELQLGDEAHEKYAALLYR